MRRIIFYPAAAGSCHDCVPGKLFSSLQGPTEPGGEGYCTLIVLHVDTTNRTSMVSIFYFSLLFDS